MTTSNAYRRTRRCVTLATTFWLSMTALSAKAENEVGSYARLDATAEAKLDVTADDSAESRPAADRGLTVPPSSQTIDRAPATDDARATDCASVWSAAPTVETLLQLDTQAALVAERKRIDRLLAVVRPQAPMRRTVSGMPSTAREPEHDAVVLNAIYGVGGALTAEVTIDGERQRLRTRSRAKNTGHENEGDGIVRIDHVRQCVVLRRAGVERSACLTPVGSSFAGDAALAAPDNARATPVMLSAGSAR